MKAPSSRQLPSAPDTEGDKRSISRLAQAIRLSPWAPILGKACVVLIALAGLAALGNAALAHPVERAPRPLASLPPSKGDSLGEDPEPLEIAAAAVVKEEDAPKESPASAILQDGRVVLNLAGEAELTKLPGIGPKRAQSILAVRQRLGRFRRVEDLLRVKGIGRKMLERIRPAVVLDPPAPPIEEAGDIS